MNTAKPFFQQIHLRKETQYYVYRVVHIVSGVCFEAHKYSTINNFVAIKTSILIGSSSIVNYADPDM